MKFQLIILTLVFVVFKKSGEFKIYKLYNFREFSSYDIKKRENQRGVGLGVFISQ